MKNKKARILSTEARLEHYKEMADAAMGELHFQNTQIEELLNVLTVIEDMGDNLISSVCKNAKEKHHINRLIHTRKLFSHNP